MSKKRSTRDRLRGRQEQHSRDKDSGSFGKSIFRNLPDGLTYYKIKKGKNLVDIIPFEIKSSHYPGGELEEGDLEYVLPIWVHRKVGPGEDNFVCLKKNYGKPCPICEEADIQEHNGADEDTVKALRPKKRVVYNIIDLDDEEEKIQLLESSHFQFEKELIEAAETEEDELVVFADLDDGRSVFFKGSEESFGSYSYMKPKDFRFKEREAYEEDIIDDTHSLDALLHIPSYEEMKNSLYGTSEEEDEEPEEKPSKRSRRSREDDSEDEEPEEKPRKRKRGGKSEEKEESSNECPYGHIFGKDCDSFDECEEDCKSWDACSKKYDELN